MPPSLPLSLCLMVCLSIRLYVSLSVALSVGPSACVSVCVRLGSPKVQVSALKACSALLAYLSMDDAGMKFRSLVQPCLQVRVTTTSDYTVIQRHCRIF